MATNFYEAYTKASMTDLVNCRGNSAPSVLSTAPLNSPLSDKKDTRPLRLESCLFPSSEDSFGDSGHFGHGRLYWPVDDLDETSSGEFAFLQVTPGDFTVLYDQSVEVMPPSPNTMETQSSTWDTSSSTTCDSEGKAKDETASNGASSSPERLIVRNTFIEFESDRKEQESLTWNSCPPVIMTEEHRTKYPLMEEAHVRGDCRPCAYFLTKGDGCREEGACKFCHLCPPGALKKKKKEKVKTLKERDYRAKIERKARAEKEGGGSKPGNYHITMGY